MTSTPTALWVVPVPDFGGVARHVVDMARAGLPGFNLVVFAPEGKLTSRLEELGVTVIKAELGPKDGISHFRGFSDNMRISRLHAGHFCTMLLRRMGLAK